MTTNPAVEILKIERDALIVKVREAEALLRKDRADLHSIETAIGLLSGQPASVTEPAKRNRTGPTLKDMIYDILREAPHPLKTGAIETALKEKGRAADTNTVLSMLSRVRRDEGTLQRVPEGWRYVGPFAEGHVKSEAPNGEPKEAS